MTSLQFVVPPDEEILDALGVLPVQVGDEPTTRQFGIAYKEGDQLIISYDLPGRSVRIRWLHGSEAVVDIFREAATRLAVESARGEARVVVTFEAGEVSAELLVQVYPAVRISDRLLFT